MTQSLRLVLALCLCGPLAATVIARRETDGAHRHRIVTFRDVRGRRLEVEDARVWATFWKGRRARLTFDDRGWITRLEADGISTVVPPRPVP